MLYGIIGIIAFAVGYVAHKILCLKDCEYVATGNIKEL